MKIELVFVEMENYGLIDYVKYLSDQITAGMGVPPELLEASMTYSGYSGQRIPLEAIMAKQQHVAGTPVSK